MLARLLVPALVFALAGCIPTGNKCGSCSSPPAEEVSCCTEQSEQPSCCTTCVAATTVATKAVSFEELQSELAAHQGRVLVLQLWNTDTLPAEKTFHQLVALQQEHGSKGLVCLSVCVADPSEEKAALAFLKKVNVPVANFHLDDPFSSWQEHWQLENVPAVLVLDRAGKRAAVLAGEAAELEPTVQKLLTAPAK